MPLSSSTRKSVKRAVRRITAGDALLVALVSCIAAVSAAFPFYVHFHQDQFGPPLMRFSGDLERNLALQQDLPAYQRQISALVKPRLQLDQLTTGSIAETMKAQQQRRNWAKQPFPGDEPPVPAKIEIMFVSAGRLLALDSGRVESLKIGSMLSDGSSIRSISRIGSRWEVRTSSGAVHVWSGVRR
jgi:hypothetical protein